MKVRAGLLAAVVASGTAIAFAQQPAPAAPQFAPPNLSEKGVRSMAAACSMCHGTEGRPVGGSDVPALAGRPREEIVQAMAQFKANQRAATIMHQISKGYGDAEIAALADYFSRLAR